MDKAYLIWDRTWSGRVYSTLTIGSDATSTETISKRIASIELTGEFLRLAHSRDPQALRRLSREFPPPCGA